MILRKKGPTLFWLLVLELAVSYSQNDKSYDTSDWIPINQPCRNCGKDQYVSASRGTGRVLNLPKNVHKHPLTFRENRNTRQANNYQQYITQGVIPTKQKVIANNKEYPQQNAQENVQYKTSQEQLSPAQLQQAYTNQHLLPNIDLITRQVLQQSQKLSQQAQPTQIQSQQYQTAPQIYNPALFQQNLLKQNYPNIPQQFSLPQQVQPQQSHLYQQQAYLQQQHQQQQLQKLPQLQYAQQQNIQPIANSQQPPRQQIQQIQNPNYTENFYNSGEIQNINHGLLSGAGQTYQTVDITSTTPKSEKENVQLLYVPLEHLQQRPQKTRPVKTHRQKQVSEPLKKENLLENIEKDFIEQALQAHRLQQQFEQPNFYPQPVFTPTEFQTTLKPVSRKRKPHQPPLAVYMNGSGNLKVTDVLNALKDAKTIDVQDTIGPEGPHVFVGPANLDPPEGFSKFDLPYLSSIESNRIERKVDKLPFFVAPLNYKTPSGYSKIPFPSPHVGSVVVNTNELEKNNPLETVPSVADFLNPYESSQVQPSPLPNVNQQVEFTNVNAVSQEVTPTYHVRRPSRARGRQQSRTRTNLVAQTIQNKPKLIYESTGQNSFDSTAYPGVSSTVIPSIEQNTKTENIPNVEINNPSLNLNSQLKSQIPTNYYSTTNSEYQQQQRQQLQKSDPPKLDYISNEEKSKQSNSNYFSESVNVTPAPSVQSNNKQQISTPKYFTNYEIVPSISSTISPYNDKHGAQEFFQQFENIQSASFTPNPDTFESYSNAPKDENNKGLINANIGDVYSIIPGVSTEKSAQNDRRYLPLDSNVRTPSPHIDYEDIFQLPVNTNQVRHNQKQSDVRTAGFQVVQLPEHTLPEIQRNPDQGKYTILEEYPIPSDNTQSNRNSESYIKQQQKSEGDYDNPPVRKTATRKRTRTRGQATRPQIEIEQEHNPRHETKVTNEEKLVQQPNRANHHLQPAIEKAIEEALTEKNNNIQSLSNINTYDNNFHEDPSSPIASPVLPGLINSLEDPSIRQLLTPILLAPPEKSIQLKRPTTNQPIQISTTYDQFSYTTPGNINYNYDHDPSTNTQAPTPTQAVIEVETTTQKRQRSRGRGHSRYNDRITTSSPRRNPQRTRTPHPSRNRYRQETTTQAYVPVKQSIYTTTTETSRRSQPKQRFRTRGRPLQNEHYASTTTTKVNLFQIPETTTIQIQVAKQEVEAKVEIENPLYENQPIRKPQLITRSKILTPEEEYLVNKYNLEVSTINDPVTENLNQQYPSYNEKEESLEQKLDSSKTINIQQPYPITSTAPIITELETTTTAPTKQRYLSKNNIERNLVRTEHPPVKIRTRIRSRKITQRPTTTSTSTTPPILSSVSSVEEQEREFYGFIRQPTFSKPITSEAAPKTLRDNSLYAPIIISSSPSSSLYDDEYVDTNEDGIQIFTNNQQSPSSPVHFIGEILPKPTATSEKYYEATHESLPSADKYVSIPITTTTVPTTTTEPKRRGRLPLRGRNIKQATSRTNAIQANEGLTPQPIQRTRSRGRAHFKLPPNLTTEQSSDTENYPQSYLQAKDNNLQAVKQQTEKPSFQITIDPDYGSEDQESHSSILRPRILPPSMNQNYWNEEEKTTKRNKDIASTTELTTETYETTYYNSADVTTEIIEEASTPKPKKKRGYWKLVKLRKIIDDFEVAESQNVGVVSINNYNDESNFKEDRIFNSGDKTDPHVKNFNAKLDTKKQRNDTESSLKSTLTATETTSKMITSTETPTTATPFMPDEIETTTIDNEDISFMLSEDNSDLDDVTIKDNDSFVDSNEDSGIVETSTSTSTEISHKTEICYKGLCINSS